MAVKKTTTKRTRTKRTTAKAKTETAAKPAAKASAKTPAKRGRKPGSSNPVNAEAKKKLNPLYTQFTALLKRKKVSKLDLASKISMSYQGFLNSYNNKNIRLETWHEIADELGMVFTAKLESTKKAEEAAALEASAIEATTSQAAAPAASDNFTGLKLNNAEDKVQILERQIASLESQLSDKQTIIELLKERK